MVVVMIQYRDWEDCLPLKGPFGKDLNVKIHKNLIDS